MGSGAGARIAWSRSSRLAFEYLRHVAGHGDVERLAFEESESAYRRAASHYDACRRAAVVHRRRFSDKTAAGSFAAAELPKHFGLKVLVMFFDHRNRGIFRVPRRIACERIVDLLDYDGDSVCIADDALDGGIRMDFYEDSIDARYEVEIWRFMPYLGDGKESRLS